MQNNTRPQESLEQILSLDFLSRFWLKVNKTDICWLWTGAHNEHGYGLINSKMRILVKAHRASWIIHNGPIPDGLWVLHDCPGGDNPSCVRPDHLWIGNQIDNMNDMAEKGRSGRAKLNPQLVTEIRNLYLTTDIGHNALARQFNVDKKTVFNILHGLIWKHVPSTKPPVLTQPELL